ncbi:acetylxylan esterase [Streptomyces sp. NBC_01235]|uniref:acetylxylan esterase n=1 Tax=Streptomyces sp. NBC_01235 TaxID=2903788 RepID=UPI002E15FAD8|nr:acetylxylan esterase [Streptomyces sp. NBC_01235]
MAVSVERRALHRRRRRRSAPAPTALGAGARGESVARSALGSQRGRLLPEPAAPRSADGGRLPGVGREGPYPKITTCPHRHSHHRVAATFATLGCFDGVHFAQRATTSALFGVGLTAPVCPPSTVYAAINHYAGQDRTVTVRPFADHDGGCGCGCGCDSNNIPHTVSCRALGVSESWFHKWRDRRPTGRELRRRRPADEIREIFTESGGSYGSPKIFILLVRRGWRTSVNTVAKLMAELGLVARKVRYRSGLTRPGKRPAAPDFVKRDSTAEEPDLVWAGDMTEIVTEEASSTSPRSSTCSPGACSATRWAPTTTRTSSWPR